MGEESLGPSEMSSYSSSYSSSSSSYSRGHKEEVGEDRKSDNRYRDSNELRFSLRYAGTGTGTGMHAVVERAVCVGLADLGFHK